MDRIRKTLKDWVLRHAQSPHAKFWLGAFSFAEASFFPIPPDVLLVAILLAGERAKWFFYASLTTVFSVLGGVFGYLIGAAFFGMFGESIIAFYGLEEEVLFVADQFARHAFLAIFLAAFTPLPYKVFTITAGLFGVPLILFVVASLMGRGLRFFSIAYLMNRYGERIAGVLYTYFNIISLIVLMVLVTAVFLLL